MKKAFFLTLIYVLIGQAFFTGAIYGQQAWATVKRGSKWFFIDKTGKVAIQQLYDEVGERFENGLAPAKINGKWGYINTAGKFMIKPQFLQAYCFTGGKALVQQVKKDTSWYLIDKTGKLLSKINEKILSVDTFTDGIYMLTTANGTAYILSSGKMLHAPENLTEIYHFSDGMARVRKGTKYGFIDTSGILKIDYIYDGAANYREGKSCVQVNGFYYLIDKNGNKVKDINHLEDVTEFTNGIALARFGGKYIIYNYIKNITIQTDLDYSARLYTYLAYPVNDGWARYWSHQPGQGFTYSFISADGTNLNMHYQLAQDYSEGMAAVKLNNAYGYLDKKGKPVIDFTFDEARPFYKVR